MTKRVGYVLKQYPRLSETFILDEILGLEAAGVDVAVHSLRPATEGRFHPALAEVRAPVRYLHTAIDRAGFMDTLAALPHVDPLDLARTLTFVGRFPEERRARLLLQGIELADIARRDGIDHLHAHFLTVSAHTCHIAHLLSGVSYSVTAHAKDIYRSTVDWSLGAELARAAAAIVTVCDANEAHLSQRLPNAHLRRIYNGLGPQPDPVDPTERRSDHLLGVGRLVPKKGFDLLLLAIAILRREGHEVSASIVGDGECRNDLIGISNQLGLTDHVQFLGAQTRDIVAAKMRQATMLVAPCVVGPDGNQDALPTVLLEALAAGLPAVATRVAGIPEIIEHGTHGLLADPDPTAIAAAIAELLADPARRAAMSAAGPPRQRERFDRARSATELVGVFNGARARGVAA